MKLSTREIMLAWVTFMVLLYAATYLVCKPQIAKWKELRAEAELLDERVRSDRAMIEGRAEWERKLGELKKSVRPLPAGKGEATYLKRTIGDLAAGSEITLRDRRDGEEVKYGGVYSLPITCPWDGNTAAIVKLLFELESHSVMFDVKELTIRSSGNDQLKGSFTVYCLYVGSEGQES